jgi:UDP-N-acetylglucosamine 2-epimerase (non-hydrolysing)
MVTFLLKLKYYPYNMFKLLFENKEEYEKMSKTSNPYGDGHA